MAHMIAVDRRDLSLSERYYLPVDGRYYRVAWLGTCGYFDRTIPIERFRWETGPYKGHTDERYSYTFFRRDDSEDTTAGYVNGKLYQVEYLCPWGWEQYGTYLGKVVAAKIRAGRRQFSQPYEFRAVEVQ